VLASTDLRSRLGRVHILPSDALVSIFACPFSGFPLFFWRYLTTLNSNGAIHAVYQPTRDYNHRPNTPSFPTYLPTYLPTYPPQANIPNSIPTTSSPPHTATTNSHHPPRTKRTHLAQEEQQKRAPTQPTSASAPAARAKKQSSSRNSSASSPRPAATSEADTMSSFASGMPRGIVG
jgi:hypothetical protein